MLYIKIGTVQEGKSLIDLINEGEGITGKETTKTYCKIEKFNGMILIPSDDIVQKYTDIESEEIDTNSDFKSKKNIKD